MSKRLGIIVALLLITVLAAGCGGGSEPSASSTSSSSADTQNIEVVAVDLAFNPGTVTVKVGTPVAITLKNEGALGHDLYVDEFNVKSPLVAAGQSTVINFTPNKVGDYKMYCAEPGHEAGGMVATLSVIN